MLLGLDALAITVVILYPCAEMRSMSIPLDFGVLSSIDGVIIRLKALPTRSSVVRPHGARLPVHSPVAAVYPSGSRTHGVGVWDHGVASCWIS